MHFTLPTSSKRRPHVALLTAALLCALLVAERSPAAADTATPLPKSPAALAAQAAPLLAKTANGGKVRVIVQLNTPFNANSAQAAQAQLPAIQQARAQVIQRLAATGARTLSTDWVIPFTAFEVDSAGLQTLVNAPEVVGISEDHLNHIMEPKYPTDNASDNLIGAPTAWSRGFTGAGQVVAVLDTGVQATHPFFGGRVVEEACFSTSYTDPTYGHYSSLCPGGTSPSYGAGAAAPCASGCEHGTHVAGIAAGNGLAQPVATAGVAIGADIAAAQVFIRYDPDGSIVASDTDILNGLNWVYQVNKSRYVAAVNLSLGGSTPFGSYCDSSFPAYKSIIDTLRSVNIATVIASGNSFFTSSLSSPACISTAISVGAVDDSDNIPSFSNSASFLTLLAPGVSVYSSFPGNTYAYDTGTSMAAPHVAGAIAILKQQMPEATVSQVIIALRGSGRALTDSRNNVTTPRIKVDSALPAIVSARTKHIGFYNRSNATFYLRNSNTSGYADITVTHGDGNTYPVVGDWDGDGIDTVGLYNQATGVFLLYDSNAQNAPVTRAFVFGNPGDKPMSGRWVDGTPNDPVGKPHDGVGVRRDSNGLIYLISAFPNGAVYADYTIVLGNPGWPGFAGRWYGSPFDTSGVYNPSIGRWYFTAASCNGIPPGPNVFCNQFSTSDQYFGSPGGIPFAGDWVGTGVTGIGLYNPTTANFSLLNFVATNQFNPPPGPGANYSFQFGNPNCNCIPLAGHWIREQQPSQNSRRDSAAPTSPNAIIINPASTKPPVVPPTATKAPSGDPGQGQFD